MSLLRFAVSATLIVTFVSCKPRKYNDSETQSAWGVHQVEGNEWLPPGYPFGQPIYQNGVFLIGALVPKDQGATKDLRKLSLCMYGAEFKESELAKMRKEKKYNAHELASRSPHLTLFPTLIGDLEKGIDNSTGVSQEAKAKAKEVIFNEAASQKAKNDEMLNVDSGLILALFPFLQRKGASPTVVQEKCPENYPFN